jgi:DinB superfamily
MAYSFHPGLENLRAVRLQTLELIRPLSQRQLDYVPAAGKWSAGEVVDHIILAADSLQQILEELVQLKRNGRRPYVRRTFADFDVSFAFLPKALLPFMELPLSLVSSFVPGQIRDFLIQNRLLPFRAATAATPRHGLPAEDLKNRLLASFESVRAIFEKNADLDFGQMEAQHPLFGNINMLDLPRLMASHEQRHQKQIMDVLATRNPRAVAYGQ